MVKNLRIYFLKPYFFAFVLSIIVIVFLPEIFNKYEIRIVDSGKLGSTTNTRVYCYDLDHDGFSEKVYSFESEGKHSFHVRTWDGGLVDQWNTHADIAGKGERLSCGDYDNDGFDEVYAFYERNDTVFLYCFEPMDTISPLIYNNKMVCTLSHQYAEPDYSILNILFQDINGDAKEDLFFVINSGKSKFPRNLFIYDILRDSIIKSEDYGNTLHDKVSFCDFNRDCKMEICGGMVAAGQISDSLGYDFNDYSTWLMAFDHRLKLLFEPIEFPGFRSKLDVLPVSINDSNFFAGFYNHTGPKDNYPKLFLVNTKGEIIREHKFPKSSRIPRSLHITKNKGKTLFNVFDAKGFISVFDQEFQLISEHKLSFPTSNAPIYIDLDKNETEEWIFETEGGLLISDTDFKHPVIFMHHFPINFYEFSIILNGDDRPTLFFYSDNEFVSLQYFNNPLALLRFPIYMGIYLSIWFFIVLIRKLQLIQIKKQESIRNQIVNLQLKGFRNQIDPHFTFNVFNTIASMIRKENPKTYPHFIQFSKLIRNILESSDKITRTLEEEINYLESYLELEKLRFSDKFDYSIKIENNIDISKKIPKMILQTYVENAIKHGIKHKKGKGLVNVKISKIKNSISFEITDDGIGREKAKEVSKNSTGFGLKIMDNYFKLFNEYNDTKIKYEIIDLFDKQNIPAGTKVRILIPLNFSYKLKKLGKG